MIWIYGMTARCKMCAICDVRLKMEMETCWQVDDEKRLVFNS